MPNIASVVELAAAIIGDAAGIVSYIEKRRTDRELKELKREAERLRKQVSVQAMKQLMDESRCPGGGVYAEVLCLPFHKSVQDATAGLESLSAALKELAGASTRPPVDWIQRKLGQVCDGDLLGDLGAEEDRGPIYSNAMECYKVIVPWLSDYEMQTAAHNCLLWLKQRQLKEYVVSKLLPDLLQRDPTNTRLILAFRALFDHTEEARTRDEQNAIIAALRQLPKLTNLGQDIILDLFIVAFQGSIKDYAAYGTHWVSACRMSIDYGLKGEVQRREIARRVAAYVTEQEPGILGRLADYRELAALLATIHGRPARPQNRHVITADKPMQASITLTGGASATRAVDGVVGNLGLGDPPWKAGAWVTGHKDPGWPSQPLESWRPARLDLGAPLGERVVFDEAEVKGPLHVDDPNNVYGHTFGFRVQMPRVARDSLGTLRAILENCYPLKR